jgi:hypothetical protein
VVLPQHADHLLLSSSSPLSLMTGLLLVLLLNQWETTSRV